MIFCCFKFGFVLIFLMRIWKVDNKNDIVVWEIFLLFLISRIKELKFFKIDEEILMEDLGIY